MEAMGEPNAEDADVVGQKYMATVDTMLTNLEASPDASDWERASGATRRTLTRQTHSVHQRYGLSGLHGQTDWRSVRDFHRLLIGTIFLTHESASVASVARALGYRAPGALCHAFARAGLPPPGKIRTLVGRDLRAA